MTAQPLADAATILDLAVDPAAADLQGQLLAVAGAILPAWAGVTTCAVQAVTGGITNLLYRLRSPGRPPLLVRVYGRNTDVVIDRESENHLFADLSRLGFAPPYYGRFRNGRIEGWLEGTRPLEPHEMGEARFQGAIARRLREMHDLPMAVGPSALWTTLQGWMAAARGLDFQGAAGERYAALELDRFASLLDELEAAYRDRSWGDTPGARAAQRVVMAHNDLLSGNILYGADRDEIRFVDYEYGAPAPAAFDVANHFCEYAGFDSDFARRFPGADARTAFVAAYLGPGASPRDVADFCRVVEFMIVPDHLWWGTWAVVQAAHSPIDFDYLGYAALRLAGCDLHQGAFGGPG